MVSAGERLQISGEMWKEILKRSLRFVRTAIVCKMEILDIDDVMGSGRNVWFLYLRYPSFGVSLYPCILAVMQSEGYRYLEESCPLLISELLRTFASADENSNLQLSRKRSGSSIFGLDLAADGAAAESVNPNGRRVRRRF